MHSSHTDEHRMPNACCTTTLDAQQNSPHKAQGAVSGWPGFLLSGHYTASLQGLCPQASPTMLAQPRLSRKRALSLLPDCERSLQRYKLYAVYTHCADLHDPSP